MSVINRNPRF